MEGECTTEGSKETKPQMEQKYEVTDWLDRVNHLQEDAKEMIKEADEEIRNKALRWFCPKKCCSYNRVGKEDLYRNIAKEVQNLKKLQSLILHRTPPLLTIPMGVISSLSSLQAFRRVFDQILLLNSPLDDEVLLKELESLEHIDEIGIFLSYASFVQKVLDSDTHKLRRRIKQLQLVQGTDHPPKLSLRGMEHLERLELLKCSSLTEVEIVKENNQQEPQGSEINVSPDHRWRKMQESFPNLCIVRICDCPIKNVTCLINVPSLQSLKLSGCNEIIEVISEDHGQDVFRNLEKLSLKRLPNLKSIYCRPLQFFSLAKLVVFDCPNLRSLPFDSNSATKLRQVKGSGSWWNNLLWEPVVTKHAFCRKFRDKDDVAELVKSYKVYNPHTTPYYYIILKKPECLCYPVIIR
ncbi:hypothetical protein GH714_024053 [Hevea brasiliensis]|uniref:Rx N-terminal domain-containing protein n=1 Tax=Hevea brasiliensis TaxID=3981 RepID=A0A6A6LJ26_HEVBR|nr:hypothetical protein GH714_024053 [Hevea brasiliensis]